MLQSILLFVQTLTHTLLAAAKTVPDKEAFPKVDPEQLVHAAHLVATGWFAGMSTIIVLVAIAVAKRLKLCAVIASVGGIVCLFAFTLSLTFAVLGS